MQKSNRTGLRLQPISGCWNHNSWTCFLSSNLIENWCCLVVMSIELNWINSQLRGRLWLAVVVALGKRHVSIFPRKTSWRGSLWEAPFPLHPLRTPRTFGDFRLHMLFTHFYEVNRSLCSIELVFTESILYVIQVPHCFTAFLRVPRHLSQQNYRFSPARKNAPAANHTHGL